MHLEGTVLSEICWAEKDKHRMISFTCTVLKKNPNKTKQMSKQNRDRPVETGNTLTVVQGRVGGWGGNKKQSQVERRCPVTVICALFKSSHLEKA